MRICLYCLTFCVLLILVTPPVCQSCTGFCLGHNGEYVVGRNADWDADDCLIVVNKRGINKTALTCPTEDYALPAQWTSKYGSITFNPYGRDLANSGMNEAGLVVQLVGLMESKYPEPNSHPTITTGQWVQYQLDNYSSSGEVIANAARFCITQWPLNGGCHFFVCDKKGVCASIEFLDGKLMCHTNETMPVKVLTNSTYQSSVNYWRSGTLPIADEWKSVERFVKAANVVKNYGPKSSQTLVADAFDILTKVEVGEPTEVDGVRIRSSFTATEWSIVHDPHTLKVFYRTFENQKIRSIDLAMFDFSCKTPVKILDIQSNVTGEVTRKFVDYTVEINKALIENTYRKSAFINKGNLKEQLVNEIGRIALYPESTVCTE